MAWTSRTAMVGARRPVPLSRSPRGPMPGVVVALIVLLVAFAAGRRALAGLAVVALLPRRSSHYYYALETTLLVKSAALFATGVVLVGARAWRCASGSPIRRPTCVGTW